MFLFRNALHILFLFLNTFSSIENTPADGDYLGKCTPSRHYCNNVMLTCYIEENAEEGICDCKEKTSYIEGQGCKFMGELNGFCNETIKCISSNSKCNNTKGDGICVCERFYDTSKTTYCARIDSKGMLGGECGLINNKSYECNDPFNECVQLNEHYSQCRCMKGYSL